MTRRLWLLVLVLPSRKDLFIGFLGFSKYRKFLIVFLAAVGFIGFRNVRNREVSELLVFLGLENEELKERYQRAVMLMKLEGI